MGTALYQRQYMRARRARLVAAGLCSHCGMVPPRPGRRQCAACAAADVARAHRRWVRRNGPRKGLHQCVYCGAIAMPGLTLCGVCSERQTTHKAHLRARYKAEGRCTWCGSPREREDRVLCSTCTAKRAARYQAKKLRSAA